MSEWPKADWETPDGRVRLYRGDCLSLLPTLPAGEIDAVVTDPPYGIAHPCNYGTRKRGQKPGRNRRGLVVWTSPRSNDYPDVIGDGAAYDPSPLLALERPSVLWGGNHFADRLPAERGWLVWDKERPDELDQATCELAWTNCVKGVRRFRHLWHGMMRASEHGENYHPTQKPVALMRWILGLRWIPKGLIFDPYMGSGPFGVACVQLNRPYVGVELSPDYFAIAVKRIERALAEPDLFRETPAPSETADLFE